MKYDTFDVFKISFATATTAVGFTGAQELKNAKVVKIETVAAAS
jgi:hypothetical protein